MRFLNLRSKTQKSIYWILSCTWGILTTLPGALVTLVLMCFGYKPKRFGWDIYINIGNYWGGFSLGPFFFTDIKDNYDTKCHEHGHGLQNIVLGPLFIFIIGIRSVIRYWLFEIKDELYRQIFSIIISSIIFLGSLVYFTISIYCFNLTNFIISTIVLSYSIYLLTWLNDIELPKFENKINYPKYEDFWAEAQASKYGKILIDK